MVMIWNSLAGGDPNLCAIIVIVNSVLQIILYSPMALLFVKVISHSDNISIHYGVTAIAVLVASPLIPLLFKAYFRPVPWDTPRPRPNHPIRPVLPHR